MTVIAWDGKKLVVDRLCNSNGTILTCKKFREMEDGTVMVSSGSKDHSLAMMDWYAQGAHSNTFPKAQTDDATAVHFVVLKDGRVVEYGRTPFPMEFLDNILAWGAGSDLAIGAMEAGADAEQAVEIASRRSTTCGGGVDVFPRPPAPEQWSPEVRDLMGKPSAPTVINTLKSGGGDA